MLELGASTCHLAQVHAQLGRARLPLNVFGMKSGVIHACDSNFRTNDKCNRTLSPRGIIWHGVGMEISVS